MGGGGRGAARDGKVRAQGEGIVGRRGIRKGSMCRPSQTDWEMVGTWVGAWESGWGEEVAVRLGVESAVGMCLCAGC